MPEFTPNENRKEEKKLNLSLEKVLLQLLKNWWVI